jgi:hypothetical protein
MLIFYFNPTQPPIQWAPGAPSSEGREVDHTLSSHVDIKNVWTYSSTSPYVLTVGTTLHLRFDFV